jgi:uncharacterized membrane protein YebE (DUF533 family)
MNIEDILGAVTRSGLRGRSSTDRLRNSLGGWAPSQGSGGPGGALGGLGGGGQGGSPAGLGGRLGEILNQAGRAVGGNRNLAIGGLGALAGVLLGGRQGLGGAVRGGLGGGVMALLGAMAYQALKNRGGQAARVPLGLAAPQNDAERTELARNSELVLKAMINAAKADGRVEQSEIQRILGRVQEGGADAQALEFLAAELKKPMQTDVLISAARGQLELAAELYSASLLAIEVDTPEEKRYLQELASALGLEPEVVQSIHRELGLA